MVTKGTPKALWQGHLVCLSVTSLVRVDYHITVNKKYQALNLPDTNLISC